MKRAFNVYPSHSAGLKGIQERSSNAKNGILSKLEIMELVKIKILEKIFSFVMGGRMKMSNFVKLSEGVVSGAGVLFSVI